MTKCFIVNFILLMKDSNNKICMRADMCNSNTCIGYKINNNNNNIYLIII